MAANVSQHEAGSVAARTARAEAPGGGAGSERLAAAFALAALAVEIAWLVALAAGLIWLAHRL